MKKLITFTSFGLAAMLLAACNTVEGAGKDVEAGGEAMQEAAKDVKDEIDD